MVDGSLKKPRVVVTNRQARYSPAIEKVLPQTECRAHRGAEQPQKTPFSRPGSGRCVHSTGQGQQLGGGGHIVGELVTLTKYAFVFQVFAPEETQAKNHVMVMHTSLVGGDTMSKNGRDRR
jgi:hypothetical protein